MRRYGFASLALSIALGCSSSGGVASVGSQSLMGQMGGMSSMSSLAGNLLKSSAGDSRLSGLISSSDVDAMTPRLTNQLCALLGGGCSAPLSDKEIADGAAKLTPTQATALTQNFGNSLEKMDLSPTVQGAASKAIAPKLPGIVGGLL